MYFANDIEDLISELSAPPIVVGASLGGIIALVLSGERKIPIKRIVLRGFWIYVVAMGGFEPPTPSL